MKTSSTEVQKYAKNIPVLDKKRSTLVTKGTYLLEKYLIVIFRTKSENIQ